MKLNKLLLAVLVLVMGMISCSESDENGLKDDTNVVKFSSSIAGQNIKTRAAGTKWSPNDEIGVFMKTGAGLTTIVDGAENKKYVTSGTEQFAPSTAADAIYFSKDQTVDFIAYYPYSTLTNNIYKVNVSSQASQENIDLLYSENAVGIQNGDAVLLNFKHELSKIVFNVTGVAPITSLTDLKVVVTDMKIKADYNLADKSLTQATDVADIELKTTASGLTAVSEGIVLPTTASARKFKFTWIVAGDTKTFDWDASSQTFEQGKKNVYTVVFDDLGVKVETASTIEDWGAGSSENIDIDTGGTAGDGTQANPYSIAEVANKVGETTKWVEGYIVGSTSIAKMIGTPVKTNILLAASKDETDEAKCIIIDIDNSVVQQNLDIVVNPTLVGKKVKVQGNIVKNIFGNVLAMTNIIGQEGGAEVEMQTVEIFKETFGLVPDGDTSKPKFSEYTHFDMKNPVAYSLGGKELFLAAQPDRFPTNHYYVTFDKHDGTFAKDQSWIIENIVSQGCVDLELSIDFSAGAQFQNINEMVLKCNDQIVPMPSVAAAQRDRFESTKVSIPNGTTKIEFEVKSLTTNFLRLDNVIITGKK